jgi:hypothetical protein
MAENVPAPDEKAVQLIDELLSVTTTIRKNRDRAVAKFAVELRGSEGSSSFCSLYHRFPQNFSYLIRVVENYNETTKLLKRLEKMLNLNPDEEKSRKKKDDMGEDDKDPKFSGDPIKDFSVCREMMTDNVTDFMVCIFHFKLRVFFRFSR